MQQLHNTIMGSDQGGRARQGLSTTGGPTGPECILHLVLPCITELFNLQNDEREKNCRHHLKTAGR